MSLLACQPAEVSSMHHCGQVQPHGASSIAVDSMSCYHIYSSSFVEGYVSRKQMSDIPYSSWALTGPLCLPPGCWSIRQTVRQIATQIDRQPNKQRYAGRVMIMQKQCNAVSMWDPVSNLNPSPLSTTASHIHTNRPQLLSNFKDKHHWVKMELEINHSYKLSHL